MSSNFSLSALRQQFPVLAQSVNGKPLVYLDNAATMQKPLAVIEAMNTYYREANANVHRGNHHLSRAATTQFESARTSVQQFINAPAAENIVWTRGATEAINLVAQSWGRANLSAGDNIVLSEQEHHANIVPWQILAKEIGFDIRVIPVQKNGELSLSALPDLLDSNTKLLSVCHVSNALGIINPIKQLIEHAKSVDARILIDGAQAVAHLPIDVQALDCDFYVFSGHKMFGPTGIGVLYGKADVLEAMPPWQGGGEMIEQVSFEKTSFQQAPFKFEAGTPAIAEAIGLKSAIEFIQPLNADKLEQHESALLRYATEKLRSVPNINILGDVEHKAPVIAFTINHHHSTDIAIALDNHGIALRNGHHCTMPLMHALGVSGTLRLSLACYNNTDDIDRFISALNTVLNEQVPIKQASIDDDLYSKLKNTDNAEARYRLLLLAGKQRHADNSIQQEQYRVHGCESQTWLHHTGNADKLVFTADSDAKIIRGLLVLITEQVNQQSAEAITKMDIEASIHELGLQQYLSPSRGNGLRSIIQRIHSIAHEHLKV